MGDILLFPNYDSNTEQATISNSCNIASVLFFVFLIAYFLSYIAKLFLFGYLHFRRCIEVWVQFYFIFGELQDIDLLTYIHCFLYQKITPMFLHCTVTFFNKIYFLVICHFVFISFLFHIQFL